MQGVIEYFLHRSIFVNLLTVILLVVGGFIGLTLNREAFPNIEFDLVVVTTVYPGASPQEVEKLITIPIEESIKEVDGVSEYRSSSLESRSSIVVQIDPDVEDTQKVIDDIRSAVDRTEDLPEDAEKPLLAEPSTSRQPIIQWSLASPVNSVADYDQLRSEAERLEAEFLAMPEVARVTRRGWLDKEIHVDVDPTLLERYYIDTNTIQQALAARNVSLPGGDININNREVIIRTVGEFESADEVSRLYVRSNDVGASVQLRDVARVSEGFEEEVRRESTHGVRAIGLTVVKRQSADIITTSNKTKRIVMDFAPQVVRLETPLPGATPEDVRGKLTSPLLDYIEENLRHASGFAFFRKEALVSRVQSEDQAGLSVIRMTLNPDYIADDQLNDRAEIFDEMFLDLQQRMQDDRGEMKLPTGAGQFRMGREATLTPRDVNDISYLVTRRLGVLVTNGVSGLILVIASLFLFMGWRTSVMVALGIPIAFGMTFMAMSYLGVTMNLISMFSLVIVIGIVVDDAIIVSENIYRYMEEGHEFFEATARGAAEVFAPVLATISTTIAAFAPMMFMTGIFGKFVYTIPLVIILALVASLVECFTILPSHVYDMNKLFPVKRGPGQAADATTHWFDKFRDNRYRPFLRWAVNHRKLFVFSMLGVLIVSVTLNVLFGSFKLFPSAIDALYVKVSLPSGLTLNETERYLKAIGREVEKLPDTELDTYVGRAGVQQKEGNDPFTRRGSNYGMLLIYLHPELDRNLSADEVIARLRRGTEWLLGPGALRAKRERDQVTILNALKNDDLPTALNLVAHVPDIPAEFAGLRAAAMPTAVDWWQTPDGVRYRNTGLAGRILAALDTGKLESALRLYLSDERAIASAEPIYNQVRGALSLECEKLGGGPPVGKDIAVEITGQDLAVLDRIAEEYKEVVRSVRGVEDVDDDFLAGKEEIRLRIDENRASQAGISVRQIAGAVNSAFEGAVATSIKRPEEEVDIRVRFSDEYRNDRESLKRIYVSNRNGNLIPVSSMASFEKAEGLTVINHLDGKRLITVTANTVQGVTTPVAANAEIAKAGRSVEDKYPKYKIAFGGQNRDTEESLDSLFRAFIVAILVIYMILSSLFRSLVQPFVVLMAVPFALIGVFLAFLGHGEPLSFLAFMGIIGLSGVVVNDSIVLVDFANRIRATHPKVSNKEVAVQAGSMRLRAVLLTTLTTVAGLIPTAYGIGGYDPFLVPMALSFAWGLGFATILTLGLVPILYSLILDTKDRARGLWHLGFREYYRQKRANPRVVPGTDYVDGVAAEELLRSVDMDPHAAGLPEPTAQAAPVAVQQLDRAAEYGLSEEYQIEEAPVRTKKSRSKSAKSTGSSKGSSRKST